MKILFIAYNPTCLSGMTYLIERMKKRMDFQPVLACEGCYYETDAYEVINFEEKSFLEQSLGGTKESHTTWYNKKGKRIDVLLRDFVDVYRSMKKTDSRVKRLMQSVQLDAFIIPDDRVAGITMAFLKYADYRAVIRVPVAIQADYDKGFYEREWNAGLVVSGKKWDINRIQERIHPKLLHTVNGQTRVFYETGSALAYYVLGMLPLHPWAVGASKCTHVMVASEEERKRVLAETGDRDIPVVVTGLLEAYEILKAAENAIDIVKKIRMEYESLGERIVVFALPQMAEHNGVPWDVHINNMRVLSKEIKKKYGMFLISLHPKSRYNDYEYLEREGYAHICKERLREIIPAVDFLICAEVSAVKLWAEMLGTEHIAMPWQMFGHCLNEDECCEFLNESRDGCTTKPSIEIRDVVGEIKDFFSHFGESDRHS